MSLTGYFDIEMMTPRTTTKTLTLSKHERCEEKKIKAFFLFTVGIDVQVVFPDKTLNKPFFPNLIELRSKLFKLKDGVKIKQAYLYGSYAKGK